MIYDGQNSGVTLQRLDSNSLEPVWTIEDLSSLTVSLSEPLEDMLILTQWSDKAPYIMSITALSAANGSKLWFWQQVGSQAASISYVGTALDHDASGEQRVCFYQSTWYKDDKGAFHTSSFLFCIDPSTQNVTFNMTLSLDNVAVATFITVHEKWVLLVESGSGLLMAWDCFATDQAKPSWSIPDQSQLLSLKANEDGCILIATYATSLARWNNHNRKKASKSQ